MGEQIRHCIVATAGHVDHGKSALVRALTGTDPDRLPEEKKRGITIDLGFAHLDLIAPAETSEKTRLRVGIVDVPGHEDFVKNMVAGVSAVDAALLVVAADDGWMPQTEEHLRILDYLGVRSAVVALTKADLLPPAQIAAVAAAVRARLAGSALADAPLVPVSVLSGEGLEELRTELARVLAAAEPVRDLGKPRLPIDRVFSLRGIGTVVTGTLRGGTLGRGQNIVVQPGGATARVRGVQSYRRDVEAGQPGSRVALSLPGLSTDPLTPSALRRGQVITLPALSAVTDTLDALLVCSARSVATGATEIVLKNGASVRVHLGSSSHIARVYFLDRPALVAGERALAQLRFEAAFVAFAADRFIVRDASGRATLAGGIVLDPQSPRRGWRAPSRRERLAQRAAAPGSVEVFLTTELAQKVVVHREGLLAQSQFSALEIDTALRELQAAGRAFLTPNLATDGSWWQTMRQRAAALVDASHRVHPERAGLPLPELQQALIKAHRSPVKWSDALIADLQTHGFVVNQTVIRRAEHRLALPEHLQAAGARVRAALLVNPFEPASRAALAPDALTQQALRFLLETGEAIELSAEVVLSAGSFVRMRTAIARHLRTRGALTTSDLRQALGTTRRILVPLLERLDRDGVTRRQGDLRVLKETPINEPPAQLKAR